MSRIRKSDDDDPDDDDDDAEDEERKNKKKVGQMRSNGWCKVVESNQIKVEE
jgi:hypothetical protein